MNHREILTMFKLLRGVLYKKIMHDLFGTDNRRRTMQAVLSIMAGSLALGAILGALDLIRLDVTEDWVSASPASIQLRVSPGADETMIATLGKLEGVASTEGHLSSAIQWRPDASQPWQNASLRARTDYEEQQFFIYELVEGQWPTRKIMGAQVGYDLGIGDQVELQVNDRDYTATLNGVLKAVDIAPSTISNAPTFYTTQARFAEITGQTGFVRVYGGVVTYTPATAEAVAAQMEGQLEDAGYTVSGGGVRDQSTVSPDEHFLQDTLDGIFLILTVMSVASLLLGLLLVYNTVSAVISQQVAQIGVLKAIGASRGQIIFIYFTITFIYGLMALVLSVILGALAAHGLRSFMTGMLGIDTGGFAIAPRALIWQIAVSLLAPLLVALGPILQGAGITVREAISNYGLSGGGGWLDTTLTKITFISRIIAMAISNTFQNKVRVSLVLVALVGAGMMFIGVLSVQSSITHTFEEIYFSIFRADVKFTLPEVERIKAVTAITLENPEADLVELHYNTRAEVRRLDQAEGDGESTSITGIPVPSQVYQPRVEQGRWLDPDDQLAVVINSELASELGVTVGDWITLEMTAKRETDWQIVGLIYEPSFGTSKIAYMPRDPLLIELNDIDQTNLIWIQTAPTTESDVVQQAAALRTHYEAAGLEPIITDEDTLLQQSESQIDALNVIVIMLLALALLIAAVGAIALSGVLSINVLERRREIGVLRAIGASNYSISTLFVTEGIILGWLSWLFTLPFSYVAGILLTQALGSALNSDLVFDYSSINVLYWLVIVMALAVFASWTPARQAMSVSVRESLSYE